MNDRVARKLLTSAPLTVGWLVVLAVTTRNQRKLSPKGRGRVLRRESTNLRHLRRDPHRVLFTSLLWFDGADSRPYLPFSVGLMAPAESRLGSARWLTTGLAAHVGATYVSQSYLRWRIRRSTVSAGLGNSRDVGVSYFMLGIAGRMTGHLGQPWRFRSQAAGTGALVANVAVNPTFTELGHLSAFLVGILTARAESRWSALRQR
ncbi:rhomboid-like protein [Mycolicibacterium hodleri]|uniref:Rhomboid family intramembrane serine protease n=1 Tax=Mycolicibacterium hodleri TaxID=49897 RepID=A0A502ED88_9MYCO|nr:rhomboid-like protein [Mycolicibacterium hodleri]TPG34932.1 hypothetical protein EAH80_08900 [Mycolicibacterium hodleri]